jgi:hypothetical protein
MLAGNKFGKAPLEIGKAEASDIQDEQSDNGHRMFREVEESEQEADY